MFFIMIIVIYIKKLVNGKLYYPMGRRDRENACFSQIRKGKETLKAQKRLFITKVKQMKFL